MNQETAAEAAPPDQAPPPPAEAAPLEQAPPPPAPPARSPRLPAWFPYFALAVLPALIVGLIVYVLATDSRGDSAGVLDGFFRLGNAPENVHSYVDELPPEFPSEFPLYRGSDVHASFTILEEQGSSASFFVILTTGDSVKDVYNFYLQRLTEDPWQVEGAQSSADFTFFGFSNPEDPDVSGQIRVHHSDLDNSTVLYLVFEDLTPAASLEPAAISPQLGESRPLPPDFPADFPVYQTDGESVITETAFQRAPGATSFFITFLTRDSQNDVIGFYTDEFMNRGWSVSESEARNQGFSLSIEFDDGPGQELQGSVTADSYANDPDYNEVELVLRMSSSRGRGN